LIQFEKNKINLFLLKTLLLKEKLERKWFNNESKEEHLY